MVFAVNSDESSARNFTAFQNVAEQLNGTSSGAAAPSTSSYGAAAPSMRINSIAGFTVVLVAVIALF
jgi:hypothetical protein